MKRTRKKHNAVIKAKGVVVAAVGGTGRSPSWRVSSAFVRTGSTTGEAAAGRAGERFRRRRWRARMLGKRSLEKRCPSDGGTEGSNPSSGESDANLTSSIRDIATVTEGADRDPRKVTGSSQRSPLRAAGSGRCLHFGKCACKRQLVPSRTSAPARNPSLRTTLRWRERASNPWSPSRTSPSLA